MLTLRQFIQQSPPIPSATTWYLTDVAQALGKQDLFTQQTPQILKALREHALVESAVSSNRIEGVEVDQKRVGTIVFGTAQPRDREEEEVRGYRKALDLIHSQGASLPITEDTVRTLHALSRGGQGDAGEYKKIENDIVEVQPDGRRNIRFRTVRAAQVPHVMAELVLNWQALVTERTVQPLLGMAAFNLDFLCIHPFRDGNGRVSRLLLHGPTSIFSCTPCSPLTKNWRNAWGIAGPPAVKNKNWSAAPLVVFQTPSASRPCSGNVLGSAWTCYGMSSKKCVIKARLNALGAAETQFGKRLPVELGNSEFNG